MEYCPESENFKRLVKKRIFPYAWFVNSNKLNQNSLPREEEFDTKLNRTSISEEDYEHAKKVFNVFKIGTKREYHDLYLEADVLLLADVFENFRDILVLG